MESKEQPQQKTKKVSRKLKILAIIAGAIILYYAVAMTYAYIRIQRGDLVKWGGVWHTKEELAKKVPPQYAESVAKNTPEEVYATFKQALTDSNLDLALEQVTDIRRDKYREIFNSDKEKLNEWIKTLPGNIKEGRFDGNSAYYDWDKGDGYLHTIDFFKDSTGYWKIENI